MTNEEKLNNRVESLKLIKEFLPSNMVPFKTCECGGIVWGLKNDKGQKRALKYENGNPVLKCGDCLIAQQGEHEAQLKHAYNVARDVSRK